MLEKYDKERLNEIFASYKFIMTSAQLNREKLYYRDIQWMLREGLVRKTKRGHYHWIDDNDTNEVNLINILFPEAVLCMETALFYYNYIEKKPEEWNIAIDKNISRQKTNIDYPLLKVYRLEPELVPIGETSGLIDDVKVKIYDRERTICDVLRNMKRIDKETFNLTIQNYVKDSKKNTDNLIEYAKALRVKNKVKALIEMWL